MEPFRDELNRMRDRLHNVESTIAGVKYIQDDLREWRAEMRQWQKQVDAEIEELGKSDAIANAVADKMKQHGGLVLTRVQLIIAAVGVAAALASPIILLVKG